MSDAQDIADEAIARLEEGYPVDEVVHGVAERIEDHPHGGETLTEVITIIVLAKELVGEARDLVEELKKRGQKLFGW